MKFVIAFLVFVALASAADQDFAWLTSSPSWTQNTALWRSSARVTNVNLFSSAKSPWRSDKGSPEQWVVADLGRPTTVSTIGIVSTSDETGPKDVVISCGPSLDGPWKQVATLHVAQQDAAQNFPINPSTNQYWKLETKDNWGSDEGITINKIRFLGGAPIQCGDDIALKALTNRRFWSVGTDQVLASANSRGSAEVFSVYCGPLTGGRPVTYGQRVALRNVRTKKWISDGSSEDSTADSPTILDLGATDAEPEENEWFWIFNPEDLNDRSLVQRATPVAIRNRLTRNVGVMDGQTELRSFQYIDKAPARNSQFTLHSVNEFINTGCADNTREGFTSLELFPNIAGCSATWANSLGMCPPGNLGTNNGEFGCSACAAGWHVCGSGSSFATHECGQVNEGADPEEVFRHVCYSECRLQPGIFASAASAASVSVAPPFHGSNHQCNVCAENEEVLGCGVLAQGASGAGVGADCSNFPELKKAVFASGTVPMPVDCLDNKNCLGSGMGCCAKNVDAGKAGSWRGVMCCKDNVFSSLKRC